MQLTPVKHMRCEFDMRGFKNKKKLRRNFHYGAAPFVFFDGKLLLADSELFLRDDCTVAVDVFAD